MASNNPSACNVSPSRVGFRSGPTSPPAPGKVQVPTYDSDGLESDDETLLALSSLPKMESIRAPRQVKPANYQQEQPIISSNAVLDLSSDCIDVVQQAIDAVEEALARCPKYERREALTELLMHAKLEQARKATAHSADCYQHANVWAAMLMQVQELGRNYPKEYETSTCLATGKTQQSHNMLPCCDVQPAGSPTRVSSAAMCSEGREARSS